MSPFFVRSGQAGDAAVLRYRDPFADMRAEMDCAFDSFLARNSFGRPTLFRKQKQLQQ
jgi:hypothetical protein